MSDRLICDGAPVYLMAENGKHFILSRDWEYEHPIGRVTVPHGYKSDLASVPMPFFWWQFGKWNVAAIAHDYIYEFGCIYVDGIKKTMRKEQADVLFYEILQDMQVTPITAYLMYLAVCWFGRGEFGKNS